MTEVYIVKNKIRLQLRKTRQRVLKNVKRDISKYQDSKEKNLELLEQVKKANIETVLHVVLTSCLEKTENENNPENPEKMTVEDSTAGEHKIATVFLNSEQKSLTEGLNQNLESFREGRKTTEKKDKKKKMAKKTDKPENNNTEVSDKPSKNN